MHCLPGTPQEPQTHRGSSCSRKAPATSLVYPPPRCGLWPASEDLGRVCRTRATLEMGSSTESLRNDLPSSARLSQLSGLRFRCLAKLRDGSTENPALETMAQTRCRSPEAWTWLCSPGPCTPSACASVALAGHVLARSHPF